MGRGNGQRTGEVNGEGARDIRASRRRFAAALNNEHGSYTTEMLLSRAPGQSFSRL
jgi:hypothetical protein